MKQSQVSQSERRSMLFVQVALLLVVIVGALCFVFFKGTEGNEKPPKTGLKDKDETGTLQALDTTSIETKAESFSFDPNTADSAALSRLGLTVFQIRNIYRYRAKGGVYHRPEEFKKLYGLTVEQWHHLAPLISIADRFKYLSDTDEAYDPETDGYQHHSYNNRGGGFSNDEARSSDSLHRDSRNATAYGGSRRDTLQYPNKLKAGQTVDLNRADTTALKRIPGIGSYYARKIVQYREKLGGFTSLSQLDDLENIPLGIEQYLSINASSIKKLRINSCSLRELNAHPYISYYQARAISNHVRQFGPIHSFQDISLYEEFTPRDFKRLEPYVDFSE